MRRRRLLSLAATALVAAPAHAAAPRALLKAPETAALAGDTLLYSRVKDEHLRVFAQPLAGGPPAQVFAFDAPAGAEPSARLAASPETAAIALSVDDDSGDFVATQALAGPPTGPFAPLTPLVRRRDGAPWPLANQVSGTTVFTTEVREDILHTALVARDPNPHDVPGIPDASGLSAVFAGDLVAYGTETGVVVRDWRTGALRARYRLPEVEQSLALDPTGRVATVTDGGNLYLNERRVAKEAEEAAFAGDALVYRVRESQLRVLEPSGRIRPFGVPSRDITHVTTDGTRVLWWANGCLLLADVRDPRAAAPGPGPCPRSEVLLDEAVDYALKRTLPVRVQCISAPRACTGTARLFYGQSHIHRAGPSARFRIPAGRTGRVNLRIGPKAFAHIRHVARHEGGTSLPVELRTDDGDRTPANRTQVVWVRE
jgi:hypothetical protein